MRYLELLGGLLLHPREYVKIIYHEDRPLVEGIFTVALFEVLTGVLILSIVQRVLKMVMDLVSMPFTSSGFVASMASQFILPSLLIMGFIVWILWGVIAHVIAKAMGGGGELEPVLVVFGYSWYTKIIIILPLLFFPLAPIASVLSSFVFMIIQYIWASYINIHGVKEIHGLTLGGAIVATVIVPLIIVLALMSAPFWMMLFLPGGVFV
jgi:hypothetical protein